MLCKAKCVARMGTPDSSHHNLIARLGLPCCIFSISAWGETRGKAGNSEQHPNTVWGCCVSPSLLGGLRSTPAADHLPCPLPIPAGAIPCWHRGSWPPRWSSPWGQPGQAGRRHHFSPAGVVWGAGGVQPGGGGAVCSLHAHLHPWGALHPVSAWGVCCAICPQLGRALGINPTGGSEGAPQKGSLAMQGMGGTLSCAHACPTPRGTEKLQPPDTQLMSCYFPPARARAAKDP